MSEPTEEKKKKIPRKLKPPAATEAPAIVTSVPATPEEVQVVVLPTPDQVFSENASGPTALVKDAESESSVIDEIEANDAELARRVHEADLAKRLLEDQDDASRMQRRLPTLAQEQEMEAQQRIVREQAEQQLTLVNSLAPSVPSTVMTTSSSLRAPPPTRFVEAVAGSQGAAEQQSVTVTLTGGHIRVAGEVVGDDGGRRNAKRGREDRDARLGGGNNNNNRGAAYVPMNRDDLRLVEYLARLRARIAELKDARLTEQCIHINRNTLEECKEMSIECLPDIFPPTCTKHFTSYHIGRQRDPAKKIELREMRDNLHKQAQRRRQDLIDLLEAERMAERGYMPVDYGQLPIVPDPDELGPRVKKLPMEF